MKKKKRYRLKKGRICLLSVILIFIILLIVNFGNITNYIKLKSLNYNSETIKLINKNDLKIKKYSETLDNIINTNYFKKDNISYYLDIEYQKDDNFFDNINKLISKGYNAKEVNKIYTTDSNIEVILNKEYNKNILDILNSDYYRKDNLERYLDYKKDNVVLNVNMNLDYEFYKHDINIDNIDNLVIVNKFYKLDKDYVPKLVKVDKKYSINDNQKLTKDANDAFVEMCESAKKDGIYIYSGSSYRSYSYQNNLYKNRVKNDGLDYADKTAAKAGYSEHQTGLAIDITNKDYEYLEDDMKEYTWLINNSYKYGFILRYPKDKENITGYTYEPWHFRYITTDVATILKEKNLTYEEYLGMKK